VGFPRLTLVAVGLAFVVVGLLFLANPVAMADWFSLRLGPRDHVEIRAVPGGLRLGLGVFFLVASRRDRWTRAALGSVILGGLGLAFGRAVGMVIERQFDRVQLGMLGLEVGTVVVAFAAFNQARATFLASRNERRRME
jgi:hypothetical protein